MWRKYHVRVEEPIQPHPWRKAEVMFLYTYAGSNRLPGQGLNIDYPHFRGRGIAQGVACNWV